MATHPTVEVRHPPSIYDELLAGDPAQVRIETKFMRPFVGTRTVWEGTPVRYSFAERTGVKDLSHELGFRTICRQAQVAVCPRVSKWNRAEVLAPRLLGSDPLNGPLRVELALEFSPDDHHGQERPTVRARGIDLLGYADEVDVLLADVFEEGE